MEECADEERKKEEENSAFRPHGCGLLVETWFWTVALSENLSGFEAGPTVPSGGGGYTSRTGYEPNARFSGRSYVLLSEVLRPSGVCEAAGTANGA